MSSPQPLSPLGQRIFDSLQQRPTRRTDIDIVRQAAYDADLRLAEQPDARTVLRSVVDELHSAGLIRLPGPVHWDHEVQPALPRFVTRLAPHQPPAPAPTSDIGNVTWHGKLWWVPRFLAHNKTTATEQRLLIEANKRLASAQKIIVPIKERSLELFDDEKALDTLRRGKLFDRSRGGLLDLDTLRCRLLPLPVTQTRTAGSGCTLLIENYTTYDTLTGWLSTHPAISRTIWGAGSQLSQVLLSLPDLDGQTLYYFGDLDARGLEIAAEGDRTARGLGAAGLRPLHALYDLLISIGKQRPAPSRPSPSRTRSAILWLPTDLQTAAQNVLDKGCRIAQESIGVQVLRPLDPLAVLSDI